MHPEEFESAFPSLIGARHFIPFKRFIQRLYASRQRMKIFGLNVFLRRVWNARTLTICFLMVAVARIFGDESSSYATHNWQAQDGLPHNSIQAIAQTRDGYLWVGTPRGLARFDGDHFTVF